MKTCSKCKIEKELAEFNKQKKGKFGVRSICKQCVKEYDNNHYKTNSDKIKKQTAEWRKSNPNYINEWKEQKGNQYSKEYYSNNSDKIIKAVNKYNKKKRVEDPLFRLKVNIRTKISQSFNNIIKNKPTLSILGVNNFEEFKQYIESQFTDKMSWDNYGYGKEKWVIDHRVPLVAAKTEEEIYVLNHYTNLQPIWWDENMRKGVKLI